MASAKRRGSRSGKVSVPNTMWVCAVSRSSCRVGRPAPRARARPAARGRLGRGAIEPALALEHREQLVVIHVARGGDHEVATVVPGAVQASEIVGGEGGQGGGAAEDGVAVGVTRPELGRVQLEHEIVRRVLDAVDLLEDHVALGFEVALPEERPPREIGEDLDRERQIGVERMRLVAGIVAAGEGVEAPAPHLELERQLLGRTPLGALEHHVLEQMGDAHLLAALVGARRAYVESRRRRADARQLLGEDDEPVRQRSAKEPVVQTDCFQCGATPWAAAPSGRASCGRGRPPRAA